MPVSSLVVFLTNTKNLCQELLHDPSISLFLIHDCKKAQVYVAVGEVEVLLSVECLTQLL